MHYLIKQEKCDCNDDRMRENCDGRYVIPCTDCTNGYIETRVDADEWLREKLAPWSTLVTTGELPSGPNLFIDNPDIGHSTTSWRETEDK